MIPTQAEIVIIGGGAVGCAVAYHLAKLGKKDVLLLEKAQLTHGATWHAAGLIGQLRSSRNLTRMMQYSARLYGALEKETGQATGWHGVGSLRVAASQERWLELKRAATLARSFGFEMQLVGPAEAAKLFPVMNLAGIVGAAFVSSDGYVDPSSVTQAMARGARSGGVAIREGVRVTGLERDGRRIVAVKTEQGTVRCDVAVNAGGMWGREIGAMAEVPVAVCAVEHQYLVTEKIAGLPADLPTFRDPDGRYYVKPEVGGLAFGGWEDKTRPFGRHGIPANFGAELLTPDFDRFEPLGAAAAHRIPALEKAGVKTMINGPIPISADGEPMMGKAPGLDNFFICCGFTSGIAAAGGAGRAMAQWIAEGDPGMNLWAFDVLRFGEHHAGPRYLFERAIEAYANYYTVAWPGHEQASGRGGRRSPLYDTLKARGAVFGSKFGWERPNWFAPKGVEPVDHPSFGRANWFDRVGEEHRAVRERVALTDMTSFTKVEVTGKGALAALQRVAANNLDRPPGAIVYTQLLNGRGGIEADVTITRLEEDRFYFVTGSAYGVHDVAHLRRHLPRDGSVRLREVTASRAVINLCGPQARDVLQQVTDDAVDNAALPYMRGKEIGLGYAPALALRVSYVGELGWELHVPMDYAQHVYETLHAAGEKFGIADVGYRAISSLRLEKQYLYWGADISPDETPLEAGLGFAVAMKKPDFIGRAALERQKQEGVKRRLCWFSTDGRANLFGGEAILAGDRIVGYTTSGGYGYTAARAITCGYLAVADIGAGGYAIEAFGERFPATPHDRPLHDPEGRRLRA
ncbi:MAG: FAD-dependent oxidoreductase [Alphaproteobacteria bacterium]|nr:FAD-dependent oxidoreductase [Alphaproteobacteria bacterium]